MSDYSNEKNSEKKSVSPVFMLLPLLALLLVGGGFAYWASLSRPEDILHQMPPRWLEEEWDKSEDGKQKSMKDILTIEKDDLEEIDGELLAYRWPMNHPKPDPFEELRGDNPGTLITGSALPSDHPGAWRQFRGDGHDAIAKSESVTLSENWPDAGPAVLWQIEVGEGHAAAAIENGRVYVVDYDREKSEDAIRCLSLDTGEEIWRYSYSVLIKRNHGMSRAMPAVGNGYVVSIGPKCHVKCLKADTGELVWEKQFVIDYGTKIPLWYASQNPLIDGDKVILAPGGDVLMMAVDLATGEPVWEASDDIVGGITYTSIIPMTIDGVYQYVYEADTGVIGVKADTGEVLWTYPDWKIKIANAASPVYVGDGKIFCTGGYGAGSALLEVKKDDSGTFGVKELDRLLPKVFGSEQHTPVLYNGYLYGTEPRPKAEMVCLDASGDKVKRVWASGGEHRFEIGPYMIIDDYMFALHGQDCTLTMARVSPDGFEHIQTAEVLHGHDAWGPMAYAEGRLIVRDLTQMVCLEIGN